MKIPVFVSCPTVLNPIQDASRKIVLEELDFLRLEPRAIGKSDYPTDLPLREVYVLGTHCSGGVILGFEQAFAPEAISKRGTPDEKRVSTGVFYPSPWNQLEAGILFGLGLPLLVFREPGIQGGIFDPGVTDVFVHPMPPPRMTSAKRQELRDLFLKWQSRVREHYYRDRRPTAGSSRL
jgi:hypothetical protein